MRQAISVELHGDPKDIDVVHWVGRTSLELMMQGGMGESLDPIIRPADTSNGMLYAIKHMV